MNSSDPMTTMEPSVAPTTETFETTDFATDFTTNAVTTEALDGLNTTNINSTSGGLILEELNLGPQFLEGRCINIPAGIHLDILYTEAGQIEYKPIYNIRGARIR